MRKKAMMIPLFLALTASFLLLASSLDRDPVKAEKVEILVGTHLPLTGLLASAGLEQRWAYETAVADINAAGGIPVAEYGRRLPVRLVAIDDETEPAKAAAAVETLVTEKGVDLILGGNTSPFGVIPGGVTAEKHQKYYHATACFIPPWLEHDFKWSTLLFFDMAQTASVPFQIWNMLPEEERPRRAALFMEDTYDGRAFGKAIRERAAAFGYGFILEASLAPGAADFSPQIERAGKLGVDAILIFASVTDCVLFVRNLAASGLSVRYLHGWKGTWPMAFGKALGSGADHIFSDGFWSKDYPFPGAGKLGERYRSRFGRDSVSVGAFYAAAQILWEAVERAGSLDPGRVRQAVLENTFDTVAGRISYDRRGVGVFIAPAFQWMGEDQKMVYPFEMTDYVPRLAPPPKMAEVPW